MRYIKTFENNNFAESLKVGDFIINDNNNSNNDIIVSEIKSTNKIYEQLYKLNLFIYDKKLKKWTETNHIAAGLYSYQFINKEEYRLLSKDGLERIKMSIIENKFNL